MLASTASRRGFVRYKPTAYGRATLGAKPFRRAPFRQNVGCLHVGSEKVGHDLASRGGLRCLGGQQSKLLE